MSTMNLKWDVARNSNSSRLNSHNFLMQRTAPPEKETSNYSSKNAKQIQQEPTQALFHKVL